LYKRIEAISLLVAAFLSSFSVVIGVFPVMLRHAAAEGRLVETSDGIYKVRCKRTGHLETLDLYVTTHWGGDFFKYARTICKPLQWHPCETRIVEHENLWAGRKLRILFFSGSELWTTGWVKFWKEATVEIAGEIHGDVKWTIKVEFEDEVTMVTRNFEPGTLVEMHGLQSAAGQSNNGRLALISKPLKNASPGRLPVLYSDESSRGLKFFCSSNTRICDL
jgi:hypothetical protein